MCRAAHQSSICLGIPCPPISVVRQAQPDAQPAYLADGRNHHRHGTPVTHEQSLVCRCACARQEITFARVGLHNLTLNKSFSFSVKLIAEMKSICSKSSGHVDRLVPTLAVVVSALRMSRPQGRQAFPTRYQSLNRLGVEACPRDPSWRRGPKVYSGRQRRKRPGSRAPPAGQGLPGWGKKGISALPPHSSPKNGPDPRFSFPFSFPRAP